MSRRLERERKSRKGFCLRFRLYFRGGLAANGSPKQKWQLREAFASQLDELWRQEPLCQIQKFRDLSHQQNECYLAEVRNGITYFPIISEKIYTLAEIDILMLRPGAPGFISVGGGDIDNRLKTLLDALQPPNGTDTYQPDSLDLSTPISCLLQDDKLITRINVETDRLLDSPANSNEVVLIISVHVRASSGRMCNIGIAS